MTKTKAQLRAEAVERLRELNCMDVDCYQLLEATVDDAGEKVGYRVEIRKLIDLLTPDARESRGSFEERLHDVPVSDCPYCGCERVVIHDFNDIYKEPHSYRVEHVDEKEAFETGCFETYYSFDSAEKAVEHANMRDQLTDEPMDARRDNDGTCPDADGTASNAGDCNCGTVEDGTSKVPQFDSREKLEEDVRQILHSAYMLAWMHGNENRRGSSFEKLHVEFYNLLDRQAAITERDVLGREWNYKDTCDSLQEQVDEYAEKVDALEAEKRECMEDCANRVSAALVERDRYREKLGRAVDAAHEVVRMMEVE